MSFEIIYVLCIPGQFFFCCNFVRTAVSFAVAVINKYLPENSQNSPWMYWSFNYCLFCHNLLHVPLAFQAEESSESFVHTDGIIRGMVSKQCLQVVSQDSQSSAFWDSSQAGRSAILSWKSSPPTPYSQNIWSQNFPVRVKTLHSWCYTLPLTEICEALKALKLSQGFPVLCLKRIPPAPRLYFGLFCLVTWRLLNLEQCTIVKLRMGEKKGWLVGFQKVRGQL